MAELYSRPEHIVEHFVDMLTEYSGALGIEAIGSYDEKLLPRYPAVVVTPGTTQKSLHATHTFNITFVCAFYVYHARLTDTYKARSKADLELATSIITLLEADMSLGNNIIQGWVESDTPGVMQPRSAKGAMVVGTRINWSGISQSRF
jgi:hypothetical protein